MILGVDIINFCVDLKLLIFFLEGHHFDGNGDLAQQK